MRRSPDWTAEEFEILLQNSTLSVDQLHLKLPRQSTDAIQIVQGGIHAFHTGHNISMLSKLMVTRIKDDNTGLVCPICGIELGSDLEATDYSV